MHASDYCLRKAREKQSFLAVVPPYETGSCSESRVPSPESRLPAAPGARFRVPGPGSRLSRGYTLIEVIVAFAVLALGLTLLLGTLSGSTRQIRYSGDAGRAALHAQSLLDQFGVGEVLQPGRREGELEDGRYRWTLDVQPYRRTAQARQPTGLSEPQLMFLALTIRWGDAPRERLRLQSLRLVAPDPTAGVALP